MQDQAYSNNNRFKLKNDQDINIKKNIELQNEEISWTGKIDILLIN